MHKSNIAPMPTLRRVGTALVLTFSAWGCGSGAEERAGTVVSHYDEVGQGGDDSSNGSNSASGDGYSASGSGSGNGESQSASADASGSGTGAGSDMPTGPKAGAFMSKDGATLGTYQVDDAGLKGTSSWSIPTEIDGQPAHVKAQISFHADAPAGGGDPTVTIDSQSYQVAYDSGGQSFLATAVQFAAALATLTLPPAQDNTGSGACDAQSANFFDAIATADGVAAQAVLTAGVAAAAAPETAGVSLPIGGAILLGYLIAGSNARRGYLSACRTWQACCGAASSPQRRTVANGGSSYCQSARRTLRYTCSLR